MEMVFSESRVLDRTYVEVQERFSSIDDLAHGWEHVSRVYTAALYLAQQEQADQFIVGMAALLHDVGRTAQHIGTTHHADLSTQLATDLLQTYQVPPQKQEAILHAILAHSFSRGVEPHTLEAKIVRDADRLDALGAIGILRWAISGTLRRRHDTRSYHPDDPFAEHHEPDDTQYMLDHFYKKLLTLGDTMATEAGRALARERTEFMRAYLNELRRELLLSS